MKHPFLSRALCCGLAALVLIGLLIPLSRLCARKDPVTKDSAFFDEGAEFDVLFFGNSHMMYGVQPMELWNSYGIISYNLAEHDSNPATSYWVMKNAVLYHRPKVVVLDLFKLNADAKTSRSFGNAQLAMDPWPLSLTKIQAALDLTNDPVTDALIAEGRITDAASRDPLSLLFNYSVYHSRWSILTAEDLAPQLSHQKGAGILAGHDSPRLYDPIDESVVMAEETVSMDYVRRFVADCREMGIEVLLTWLPYAATDSEQTYANTARVLAEELDVPYINFLRMDIVDYTVDLYDNEAHLNDIGARKVTAWLGAYLVSHYDLTDHRDDPAYAAWNEEYEAYTQERLSLLAEQTELESMLTLASDPRYDIALELRDDDVLQDDDIRTLLCAFGLEEAALTPETDFVLIRGGADAVAVSGLLTDGAAVEAGGLTLGFSGSDSAHSVSLNGSDLYYVSGVRKTGVTAVWIERETGSVIYVAQFSRQETGWTRR